MVVGYKYALRPPSGAKSSEVEQKAGDVFKRGVQNQELRESLVGERQQSEQFDGL